MEGRCPAFPDSNEADFASALSNGSAGWKGALSKGIETRQAQRKASYYSAYRIAELYADLGDKDQAFRWLNTAFQERDLALTGRKLTSFSTPSAPTHGLLNWCGKWGCRSSEARICPSEISSPSGAVDPDIPILKEAKAEYAKLQ